MAGSSRWAWTVGLAFALLGCSEVDEGRLVGEPLADGGEVDGAGGAAARPDAAARMDAAARVDAEVGEAGREDALPRPSDAAAPLDAAPESSGDASPGADVGPAALDAAATTPDAAALPVCACFVRVGWCAEGVVDEGARQDPPCRVPLAEANPNVLMACDGDRWIVREDCAGGCAAQPPGTPDACNPPPLPDCPCFVQAAWCGEGAAAHGLTLDPPCRVPLAAEHADDLLACDGDTWIVREACAFGCFAQPAGVPDACNPDPDAAPTADDPGWAACPRRPLLHAGLHPEASDRLRCAGVTAGRITQTIGNAAASAGYHAEDGRAEGQPYCAAVDLRTRDLTNGEIRDLLDRLGENGFAAWYRQPGRDGWPAGEAPHIHAVFTGVRMKSQLRGQVRDFLVGRNGLASHTAYRFWQPDGFILRIIRLLFARNYNP